MAAVKVIACGSRLRSRVRADIKCLPPLIESERPLSITRFLGFAQDSVITVAWMDQAHLLRRRLSILLRSKTAT